MTYNSWSKREQSSRSIWRLKNACVGLFWIIGAALVATGSLRAEQYIRESKPEMFSYDELVQLSLDKPFSPELTQKLHAITTTPFINNEAHYKGARPRRLEIKGLGPSLRVAFWNIERGLGLEDIKMSLTDKDRFVVKATEERAKAKEAGKRLRDVEIGAVPDQIETLQAADVWVLNEVDWGLKRTQYRAIVSEMARLLNMNWAYGVEFLEIDPKQLGTETFDNVKDEATRKEYLEEFRIDKDKLRALHGTAVLSRYPIRGVRQIPFTIGYDWYKESKITNLEKAKRKAAELVGEDLFRELRRGQRMMLLVDLDVPEVAGGRVTIVATHLENRTKQKIRRQQMNQLLQAVREIPNPVVIAGDMNTTGTDSTPTSVTQILYKRYGRTDFWTTKGIQWATGIGLIYTGSKAFRKLTGIQTRIDPTSANLPGLSPNLEKGLFDDLEKFRFADGKAIDFRGDPDRTIGGMAGTLANSNERTRRGFTPTFISELIWGSVRVARFKLDWVLVKSNNQEPRAENGPYVFAPHFPRVLADLNNCLPEPISDHSPITVDLPFHEPVVTTVKKN
jgi:endonuclease/exonuclease/phosphatase family metal-dependent hydrolase